MPNTPFLDVIGHRLYLLESVESSNNYAMAAVHDGKAGHGTVYQALEQTAGRGQRGKNWLTGKNMNMALSAVFEPRLPLSKAFLLSASVALAVQEWLNKYTDGCLIKWPNDIYVHDKKIAGILIENMVRGQLWNNAIAGIGANINQNGFDEELKHAVSLKMLTGKNHDLVELGKTLCACLQEKWQLLKHDPGQLIEAYNAHLYRKEMMVNFKDGDRLFSAVVKRVTASGELVVAGGAAETVVAHGVQWLI